MIYKLIDQTGDQFPAKSRQWLICKQDVTPERTCTRGFCIVPKWEDRSPADSKADAMVVMNALLNATDPDVEVWYDEKECKIIVGAAGMPFELSELIREYTSHNGNVTMVALELRRIANLIEGVE